MTKEVFCIECWEIIRRLRRRSGYTAASYGDIVGVSRTAVVAWETARYMPNPAHVRKIAAAAPMPASYRPDYNRQRAAEYYRAEVEQELSEAICNRKICARQARTVGAQ